MTHMTLQAVRQLIANDSYAITFQSVGQYRAALLRHVDSLVDGTQQYASGGTVPTELRLVGEGLRPLSAPAGAQAVLLPLSAGRPDPGEHVRVLVYTEGTDFAGDQYFDILTEDLWEPDPDCREEIANAATHWMPLPMPGTAFAAKAEAPAELRAALLELTSTQRKLIDANAEIACLRLAQQAAAPGALAIEQWRLKGANGPWYDVTAEDKDATLGTHNGYERRTVYAAPSAPGTPEAPADLTPVSNRTGRGISLLHDATIEKAAREVESAGGDSADYHANRVRALKVMAKQEGAPARPGYCRTCGALDFCTASCGAHKERAAQLDGDQGEGKKS